MVGSTQPVSQPTTVLNTIVAEAMCKAADTLEGAENFEEACKEYVRKTLTDHQRVIFNGNGYSQEWVEEAERRGLPNIKCMVDAIPYYKSEKSIALFEKMGVMSKVELEARAAVMYENYAKYINIEARVMIDMVKKQILPAILSYEGALAKEAADIARSSIEPTVQKEMIATIAGKAAELKSATEALEAKLSKAADLSDDLQAWAKYYHDEVFMSFPSVRKPADELEEIVSKDAWPIPTYRELLFEI